MFKKNLQSAGYTLVEVVIALAIISLTMALLMAGSGTSTKNERFSGEVKAFVNSLKEAQTKSYSIKGGCPNSAKCYWRGNVLEYRKGSNSYTMYPLYGEDLSAVTGVQTAGITNKLTSGGLAVTSNMGGASISKMSINGSECTQCSVAFLAPDAASYVSGSWANFSSSQQPYTDNRSTLVFELQDAASKLAATVTFNSVSGIIEYSIK